VIDAKRKTFGLGIGTAGGLDANCSEKEPACEEGVRTVDGDSAPVCPNDLPNAVPNELRTEE
jgi:hypothetical protein